jgi:phosphatidylinositol alpha-mannosyltransferase
VPPHLRGAVHLLGRVSDAERAALLASVDVFLAPNTHGESFGIVTVEAMAAGAAVVASDISALRGVLRDGWAGLLFPVGDASAAAAAVCRLLGDDELRAELGARAEAEAKRYDWSELIADIEAVYSAVAPTAAAG